MWKLESIEIAVGLMSPASKSSRGKILARELQKVHFEFRVHVYDLQIGNRDLC